MTRVAIYGPNLPFADGATMHVHAAGCAHTSRRPYTLDKPWHIEATTEEKVITEIYPPGDFEYDPAEWEGYSGDVTIFPCANLT